MGHKRPDAKAVFRHAYMFVESTDFMQEKGALSSGRVALGIPMLVLEAFSIELLLKTLLLLDDKDVPQSHRLAVLFRRLGPKLKRRVVDAWDVRARPMLRTFGPRHKLPMDLPNALVRCDRAFEQLRYGYEDPEGMVYYLGGLPPILVDLVAPWRREPERRAPAPHFLALGLAWTTSSTCACSTISTVGCQRPLVSSAASLSGSILERRWTKLSAKGSRRKFHGAESDAQSVQTVALAEGDRKGDGRAAPEVK